MSSNNLRNNELDFTPTYGTQHRYAKAMAKSDYYSYEVFGDRAILVRYPEIVKILSEIDTIMVVNNGVQKANLIRHPESKQGEESFKCILDKDNKLWFDFGYRSWMGCLDLNTNKTTFHKLPREYEPGTLFIDASKTAWVFGSTAGKIVAYKLSGHRSDDQVYEQAEYRTKTNGKTRIHIIGTDRICSFIWKNDQKESNNDDFGNLVLKFDDYQRLQQLPFTAKDNIEFRVNRDYLLGLTRDENYNDVYVISYFHLKNGLYREFSVLSKSEIYDLLPGEKSIALHFSDKHIIIPLQSDVQLDNLFAINESEEIDWMYFASELKNRLPENLFSISLATEGIFKVKTFLFEKGRLTGLFGDERYSVIDYDEASRSLYLSKWIESRAVYYVYNLDSKELRKLPIKAQSLVYARDTAPILHSLNEAYTVEATGLKKRTIKGWTNLFGSYPELDRSFVESTFAWYSSSSPAEISPGSFFYRTHHISRQVDGNIWFWHGDYTQKELKIEKDGDKLDVQIPSLVYNVMSDSISLKPNWLRCLQDRQGRTFIAHEKKGEKRSYIQVSEWIGGKLLEKPADLRIYGRTKLLPYIDDYRRISNNLLSIHCADTLFYFHANGWHSIALEKYQRYGAFNNSTMLEGVLYLCFDNMLVKHVDENTHYLYGFKDGLPEQLYGVLSPDERTLLLLTSKGVLSFSEKPFAIKLDLQDGLASGIGRAISLKANQKVSSADNRVRFIVSLLGSIYPEDGSLFYRLKGLSGQWTKVDFRREILFEKLNPGSYSFEVYATDRHGAKTETQSLSFRILPPWYQSWWAYLAYALTGTGILFGLYKWRTYALKARNKELETKVEQRTQSLIEQQKKIKESIDYASLIQRSVLPQETELAKAWKEHFVVWKPRDVVGGDLYWLQEIPDKAGYLFAVLDCTGHGVPGALLTMTVNSALNHIVLERKISSPPLILELLHQEIGAALHQQVDSNMQDGLEIALIRLGEKPGDLSFAGAGLHLLIYDPRQNELRILRGNRYGLGGTRYQDKLVFQEHSIQPQPGFTLYLYSDGILDQPFPSQDTRRLGSQNWLQIIAGIASEPLSEQKNRIDRMIAEMLMDNEQRDDITIVGLRI